MISNNSLDLLIQKLLVKNNIPFNKEELKYQIQSHPSYPSLHSITGVLDHFNIENIAASVPVDASTLVQLPKVFLAQIKSDLDTDFVIVEKRKLDYHITNSDQTQKVISELDFLNLFTGIVVAVEKTENTLETNSNTSIKTFGAIALIVLSLIVVYLNGLSILNLLHFSLSLTGIYLGYNIFKQEQGLETPLSNTFCSGENEKKDCKAILSSKGALLFGKLNINDLNLYYFITLALGGFAFSSIYNAVYVLSILALPITLYSIYYQSIVVKKWCPLCLSVVGILWAQAALAFIDNIILPKQNLSSLIILIFITTIAIAAWSFFKNILSSNQNLLSEKAKNTRFKRNYNIFESLLKKSSKISTVIENNSEIIFGNPKSPLEIVIVTSPFCGHCKPVHEHLEQVLNKYHDLLNIKVRFSVNTANKDGDLLKIASTLHNIYQHNGEQQCLQAMHSIYNNADVNSWLKTRDTNLNHEAYIELDKQHHWCQSHNLNFTPVILINGREFPKEYDRHDLIHFIEDLHESASQNISATTLV